MITSSSLNYTDSLFRKYVNDILNDNDTSLWDEIIVKLLIDNPYLAEGAEKGYWLTRARKHPDRVYLPYTGEDIGMNKKAAKETINLEKRWGNLFYLCSDLSYDTAFKEIELQDNLQGSLGYFYINEDLKLYNASSPSAITDSDLKINGIDSGAALTVMVRLIHDNFHWPVDEEKNIYKVTNHIVKLITTQTDYDGIISKSTKNKSKWNISLVDDKKLSWGFSKLLTPETNGEYFCQVILKNEKEY